MTLAGAFARVSRRAAKVGLLEAGLELGAMLVVVNVWTFIVGATLLSGIVTESLVGFADVLSKALDTPEDEIEPDFGDAT